MVEKFEFDSKLKKKLFIMMGVGVVGLIWAFLLGLHDGHHQSRFWSNILLNVYYFTGIGIFGIFFVSANQLGYSGWITLVKRIYLSLSGFLVIGAAFALLIIGGVWLHYHNLYDHFAIHEEYVKLANTKQTFFQPVAWTIRIVLYFTLWIFAGKAVIKAINSKDIGDPKVYKRSKLMAAMWIVIFAVSESFVSWDMVMGLDPHWYSTLFGWYNFASYGCAAFAMAILLVIFLKSRGHLPQVNENHIHDMGKYMFAWSILWSYMWFDQFMLQWYANLPEDTNYWVKRFDVPLFKWTVAISVAINLGVPLLLFIKRGAKRNMKYAATIAVVVFLGHYLDFFNQTMFEPNAIPETKECCKKGEGDAECCKKKEAALATGATVLYAENKTEGKTEDKAAVKDEKPATDAKAEAPEHKNAAEAASQSNAEAKETKNEEKAEAKEEGGMEEEAEEAPKTSASLGLPELMILTGFMGAFLFMFFREFSKDTTFNENDPYLKESLRHHVEYA